MNDFQDELLRKVGQLVGNMRSEYAADDIERAAGLVVTVTDPSVGQFRCHGPFPDPVATMAWAESYTDVLNDALPGPISYTARVHLLFDPYR